MQALARILAAFLVSVVAVLTVTTILVNIFADRKKPAPPSLTEVVEGVDVLSPEQTRALLRREKGQLEAPKKPEPVMPPRQVSGFVQLEFTVNPDGSVSDVDVVGAVPEGVYEKQARAIVAAKRYTPEFEAGEAVRSRETEVIEFTVSADRIPQSETGGAPGQ